MFNHWCYCWDDKSTWPVLIRIPGTPLCTDLQLHVMVTGSMWKITVASGTLWDGVLTLHVSVCKHASSQVFHLKVHRHLVICGTKD